VLGGRWLGWRAGAAVRGHQGSYLHDEHGAREQGGDRQAEVKGNQGGGCGGAQEEDPSDGAGSLGP